MVSVYLAPLESSMNFRFTILLVGFLLSGFGLWGCQGTPEAVDPLPSWGATAPRAAVLQFVNRVTDPNGPHFVVEADRVAVFDNDGTLWSENPIYFQFEFAVELARQAVIENPVLATREPFRTAVSGEPVEFLENGAHDLMELLLVTHSGTTTTAFAAAAEAWLRDAEHPVTGRSYPSMIYQPMIELLRYLEANGFSTWIVSGGGVDFMRVFAEEIYGIPPERVIGSEVELAYEIGPDGAVLVREPKLFFMNDGPSKVIGIHRRIGRRPIAAFGNSDGDLEMLEWTAAGDGPSFCMFIHHTDAYREWAYDRSSKVGRLDHGLDRASEEGWTIMDMKRDWTTVFPPLD